MNLELRAETVTFSYEPGQPVLCGVDAAVRRGAMTGIVGPNGSGKSTLLRLMCGLIEPRGGAIRVGGKPLHSMRDRERARRIAFLPQSVNPVFSLSAFEVVCLGRYPHAGALGGLTPHDYSVARRSMMQTATEPLRDRDFNALSGGERQRVLLASILAQEPELMLLDEPTTSLDIHHEADVFTLLAQLARAGYGVGVVTHDLNLAAQFCDEVVLLSNKHTVVAHGAAAEVLTEERLSSAYGARIRVGENPFTGGPFIAADLGEDEA